MQSNSAKLLRKRLQVQQGIIALSSLAMLVFVLVWLVSTAMSGTKNGLKLDIKFPKKAEKPTSFVYDTVSKADETTSSPATADTSSQPDTTKSAETVVDSAPDSTLSSAAEETSSADDSSSAAEKEPSYEGAAMKDDFSDACFIGDSRTVGLELNADKAKATFLASTGLNVSTAFTDTVCTLSNGNPGTIIEAVGERKYHRVFIMFGINEIGWPYPDAFVENYVNLINEVKKAQPNADIYIESILPVSASAIAQGDVFTNANIDSFNGYVREAAGKTGTKYLDLSTYFKDETGNLPEDSAPDGIHFNHDLCVKWIDLLAYLVPQKEPMSVETIMPTRPAASSDNNAGTDNTADNGYTDYNNDYNGDNGYTDYNDYNNGYTDGGNDYNGYNDYGGYDNGYGY